MQTQTIERPDTEERVDDGTGSDTPKFFHYVKKDKIAESAVMGNHVVALCGEVFPVTKAAKPGSPVCPDCKQIYARRDTTQVRSRWTCVSGAGNSSWIAALSSAPIMIANPPKNAKSRKAIGFDRAP